MLIFSSLKPDGLYREDPYLGNILSPNTWYGDKWPFDDQQAAPLIPRVPYDFPDIPRKIRERAQQAKDLEAWNNLFRQPEKKNYKWENLPDGGLEFSLELAGYSKATMIVEINYSGSPTVVVKSKVPTVNIGGSYPIPNSTNLDLEAAKLTMEHGLLEITFPAKKVEKKSITLL